jgi:hypothetical protein
LGTDAERKTEKQSMRQILSRSLLTVAAASSILAATGGYASADTGSEAGTSGSPGLLSGDSVTAPVDVPVNACGNSVGVAAAANGAFGNTCGNHSQSSGRHAAPAADQAGQGSGQGSGQDDATGALSEGSGMYGEGSGAQSGVQGSPGVLSGNSLDIPVHAPVNVCGNTVDPLALLNTAMGNSCGAEQAPAPDAPVVLPAPVTATPDVPVTPPQTLPISRQQPVAQTSLETYPQTSPQTYPQLAETGGGLGGGDLGVAGATSAALLLGGAMLYRRGARPAPAAHRR